MPEKRIDLNPTIHLTVGPLGAEDERQFVLQGSAGSKLLTLRIDRDQAAALSEAIGELLSLLQEQYPRPMDQLAIPEQEHLYVLQPIRPRFEVAHFQLAYRAEQDQAVIIAVELPRIRRTPAPQLRVARFWVTREQLVGLARRIEYLLGASPLLCPLCGQLIEPGEHRCVRNN